MRPESMRPRDEPRMARRALAYMLVGSKGMPEAAQELMPHLSTLLRLLGTPAYWAWQTLRLVLFVVLMLPLFLPPWFAYACSSTIRKGVRYGPSVRHGLDIFLPLGPDGKAARRRRRHLRRPARESDGGGDGDDGSASVASIGNRVQSDMSSSGGGGGSAGSGGGGSSSGDDGSDGSGGGDGSDGGDGSGGCDGGRGCPVVIFVSGGAWIIGYRMWGFLLGLALQRAGVLCVCVDYRNFPQAGMPSMVDDVAAACAWVRNHIGAYGGDPTNLSLVGQSAGAHLTALHLLRLVDSQPAMRSASTTAAPAAACGYRRWIGARRVPPPPSLACYFTAVMSRQCRARATRATHMSSPCASDPRLTPHVTPVTRGRHAPQASRAHSTWLRSRRSLSRAASHRGCSMRSCAVIVRRAARQRCWSA